MRIFGAKEIVADHKAELVRQARVKAARENRDWREVEESTLVERKPWFVHADTDELYTVFRSFIFEPGSARLAANYTLELLFVVTDDDGLIFFERVRSPRTWSEHVAKRARRSRVRA